jgi:hypothetical protein
MLNIRSAAGAGNPIVGSFAYNAVNVMRTGPSQQADGADWVEVQKPDGGTGWVNFKYLTEYVSRETFCADTRVQALIEQLKQAVNQSNGTLLASLVSPKHGWDVKYWPYGTAAHYTIDTASGAFTSSQVIDWGGGPSGISDIGTFAQIVQPKMNTVLNSAYELTCDDISYGKSFVPTWPYVNIHYYSVVKPPTPDIVFDWENHITSIEYVNGKPYLFSTVRVIWEP